MLHGRFQLAQWIEKRGLNGREAARMLDVHFTFLSNLVTGKRLPGRENAVKIERITGIPVEAWTPTRAGKSKVRAKQNADKSNVSTL